MSAKCQKRTFCANRKTASRRSLRISIRCFDQAAIAAVFFRCPRQPVGQNRQLELPHDSRFFSLAHVSRIESRIASRGNRTLSGCEASENIAAARDHACAKLRCVSITHAYNIVRQCNASFWKFSLVLLETFEHVVCAHWHIGAQVYEFFAAWCRRCSAFCFSNIDMGGRN